jgi:hypothetical protein
MCERKSQVEENFVQKFGNGLRRAFAIDSQKCDMRHFRLEALTPMRRPDNPINEISRARGALFSGKRYVLKSNRLANLKHLDYILLS